MTIHTLQVFCQSIILYVVLGPGESRNQGRWFILCRIHYYFCQWHIVCWHVNQNYSMSISYFILFCEMFTMFTSVSFFRKTNWPLRPCIWGHNSSKTDLPHIFLIIIHICWNQLCWDIEMGKDTNHQNFCFNEICQNHISPCYKIPHQWSCALDSCQESHVSVHHVQWQCLWWHQSGNQRYFQYLLSWYLQESRNTEFWYSHPVCTTFSDLSSVPPFLLLCPVPQLQIFWMEALAR